MEQLSRDQALTLRDWFSPERPGPLVGSHLLQTGHGVCFADRWPQPRAIVAQMAANYSLIGDPEALAPGDLTQLRMDGFADAPEVFEPLVRSVFPTLYVWPRVILGLPATVVVARLGAAGVRRLGPRDRVELSQNLLWVAQTWGGPAGLAASGYAWGAFVDDHVVSIACSFFVGEQFEDIGVATEAAYRGRGLAFDCAANLCLDIRARGRTPSWSTAPDNYASLRVAEKLGFTLYRHDRLYVVGRSIPSN